MKGRNVNTIGDLSTLTEVQINQLPIRNPKVESVKSTLNNYMIQHGLVKVISCVEDMQDSNKSSRSKGSTIEQEITPSSIDDEGIQIQPEADKDLKQLSPIKEADAEPPKLSPLLLYMKEANNSSPATTEDETTGDATPRDERPLQMSSCLKDTVKQYSPSNLKKASLSELFDIQQTLNLLSTNLIEEMKSLNLLQKCC
uniref:Uncharacterized protein n=1 Tax=Arion vulgaris TaxID=1028688 RepID=A0A0B7AYF1_9EUPU